MQQIKCRRCGHPINADTSRKTGYGPVCHKKALKENKLQRGVFDNDISRNNREGNTYDKGERTEDSGQGGDTSGMSGNTDKHEEGSI